MGGHQPSLPAPVCEAWRKAGARLTQGLLLLLCYTSALLLAFLLLPVLRNVVGVSLRNFEYRPPFFSNMV